MRRIACLIAILALVSVTGCSGAGVSASDRRAIAKSYAQALLIEDDAALERLAPDGVPDAAVARAEALDALGSPAQSFAYNGEIQAPGVYSIAITITGQQESFAILYVDVESRSGDVIGVAYREAP